MGLLDLFNWKKVHDTEHFYNIIDVDRTREAKEDGEKNTTYLFETVASRSDRSVEEYAKQTYKNFEIKSLGDDWTQRDSTNVFAAKVIHGNGKWAVYDCPRNPGEHNYE